MRNAGDYEKLGMTWRRFAPERNDISPECHAG
jgi:hypothetical protein